MERRDAAVAYYGRKSCKGCEYDYIIRIDSQGCHVTDPIDDWERDEDYREEAISNRSRYDVLDAKQAEEILAMWGRSL